MLRKIMSMFMSRQQHVGQNYKTDTCNISFENVAKCRYLEKNLQILQSEICKRDITQILIAHLKKLRADSIRKSPPKIRFKIFVSRFDD
jgi:hypothetical protein